MDQLSGVSQGFMPAIECRHCQDGSLQPLRVPGQGELIRMRCDKCGHEIS